MKVKYSRAIFEARKTEAKSMKRRQSKMPRPPHSRSQKRDKTPANQFAPLAPAMADPAVPLHQDDLIRLVSTIEARQREMQNICNVILDNVVGHNERLRYQHRAFEHLCSRVIDQEHRIDALAGVVPAHEEFLKQRFSNEYIKHRPSDSFVPTNHLGTQAQLHEVCNHSSCNGVRNWLGTFEAGPSEMMLPHENVQSPRSALRGSVSPLVVPGNGDDLSVGSIASSMVSDRSIWRPPTPDPNAVPDPAYDVAAIWKRNLQQHHGQQYPISQPPSGPQSRILNPMAQQQFTVSPYQPNCSSGHGGQPQAQYTYPVAPPAYANASQPLFPTQHSNQQHLFPHPRPHIANERRASSSLPRQTTVDQITSSVNEDLSIPPLLPLENQQRQGYLPGVQQPGEHNHRPTWDQSQISLQGPTVSHHRQQEQQQQYRSPYPQPGLHTNPHTYPTTQQHHNNWQHNVLSTNEHAALIRQQRKAHDYHLPYLQINKITYQTRPQIGNEPLVGLGQWQHQEPRQSHVAPFPAPSTEAPADRLPRPQQEAEQQNGALPPPPPSGQVMLDGLRMFNDEHGLGE